MSKTRGPSHTATPPPPEPAGAEGAVMRPVHAQRVPKDTSGTKSRKRTRVRRHEGAAKLSGCLQTRAKSPECRELCDSELVGRGHLRFLDQGTTLRRFDPRRCLAF